MPKINTCYQCPDREIGCHGKCEKYKKAKQENEAKRDPFDICRSFLIKNAAHRKKVRGWGLRK